MLKIIINFMFKLLIVIAVLYLTLVVLMYVFQRKLMYLPHKEIGAPAQYGLSNFSEAFLTTKDGIKIQTWFSEAKDGFPTIIYFHGNAGNIANRGDIYSALAAKGFGVLGVSYRGYGRSEGSPDEQGLYSDARAAIEYIQKNKRVAAQNIVLYGESLGTGVATQMATEFNIGALILQAPYRSVSGRAAEIDSFIPVTLLIKDKFETIKIIASVKAPLLIFHGESDGVIPVGHGRSVFETATAAKRAYFMPGVTHNDFDSSIISAHVLDFAKEHRLVQ